MHNFLLVHFAETLSNPMNDLLDFMSFKLVFGLYNFINTLILSWRLPPSRS